MPAIAQQQIHKISVEATVLGVSLSYLPMISGSLGLLNVL
jgi:hypothetical protein